MESFVGEAQRFPVDVDAVVDILQEGSGALLHHVLHAQAHLEVFGETFDKGEKMFRRSDVAWKEGKRILYTRKGQRGG